MSSQTLRLIPCGRVSSDEQAKDEKTSLDEQIRRTTTYIVKTLEGQALSPITDDCSGELPMSARPGGRLILQMLESDIADGVVFMNASRYFRDDLEGRLQARRWISQGKRLFLCDYGEVKDDSEISFLLKSWQASQERRDIADRTVRGRRSSAEQGRVVSARVPFWLKKVFAEGEGSNPRTRRQVWKTGIELDQAGARLIRQMWEWLVRDKMSGRTIVKKLNESGIPSPTGRKWIQPTVTRCLSNPALMGCLIYGEYEVKRDRATHKRIWRKRPENDEHIYRVSCPAVLTEAEYKLGLGQMRLNKQAANPRNVHRFYLLRGFVNCPLCKKRMVGQAMHETLVYRCHMCHRSIKASMLESWTWEQMLQLMTDEALFEEELQEAFEREQAALKPARQRLDDVYALIKQFEQEAIEIGHALREAKGIVARKLQEQQDVLNEQYEKAVAHAKTIEDELSRASTDQDFGDLLQFRQDNVAGMLQANDQEKRNYLMTMGTYIEVTPELVALEFQLTGSRATIQRDVLRNANRADEQERSIILRRSIRRNDLTSIYSNPRNKRQNEDESSRGNTE